MLYKFLVKIHEVHQRNAIYVIPHYWTSIKAIVSLPSEKLNSNSVIIKIQK